MKPSKAAKQLAAKLFDQMPVLFRKQREERVASLIDSHMADLLEILNQQSCSATTCGHADCDKIRQTLEPWKPEK